MKLSKSPGNKKQTTKASAGSKPPQKIFGITLPSKEAKPVEQIDPTTFHYEPTSPIVNLVPSTVSQKYEVKGVARKVGLGIVGVFAILGLVFAGGKFFIGNLEQQLTDINEQTASIQAQITQLEPYTSFRNAVENKRKTVGQRVQSDVNMGTIYTDLHRTAQTNNINLENVAISQHEDDVPTDTAACMNPDPFTENNTIIGCITLTAVSDNPASGKGYVEDLVALSNPVKYINPFISSVATDDDGLVRFEINISFTDTLFTNQYTSLQSSILELLGNSNSDTDTEATPGNNEEETTPANTAPAGIIDLGGFVLTLVPTLEEPAINTLNTLGEGICNLSTRAGTVNAIELTLEEETSEIESVMEAINNEITDTCGGE